MKKQEAKRPQLGNLIQSGSKDVEQFQNEILRPILKMQHPIFISFFIEYLKKRKIIFSSITLDKQKKHIENILSKDIAYKNLQIGIVLGQLSTEEFSLYKVNQSQYVQLIVNHIQTTHSQTCSKKLFYIQTVSIS